MPFLKNARHEAFAQAVASGVTACEAYRKIGGRGTLKNADVHSARMMVNDGIKARIAELQAASASKTVLDMTERREFLARAVRIKLHEIDLDKDGDLIQEITYTEDGRKIKLPGKRECIMDDAKLAGDIVDKTAITDSKGRDVRLPVKLLKALQERMVKR